MALVYKPMYALECLIEGMKTYPEMWVGFGKDTSLQMYMKIGEAIKDVIHRLMC